MRFYNQPHRFYCGVDLHARCMYLCVLDQAGQTLLQCVSDEMPTTRNTNNEPEDVRDRCPLALPRQN